MSEGQKQRNWLHEGKKPQNGRKHFGNTTAVKAHYRDTGSDFRAGRVELGC